MSCPFDSGDDYFMIKIKPTAVFYQWTQPNGLNGLKYSNIASAFPCQVSQLQLVGGPMLVVLIIA